MSKLMSGPGRAAAVRRLREGTAFHRRIQTAFVARLVGATADPESPIPLSKTSSGRIDLLIAPVGAERMAVVVEVKNTDWDALLDGRLRPNFRRHVRQLQGYLDTIVGRIGESDGWDSAIGVLLYRAADVRRQAAHHQRRR